MLKVCDAQIKKIQQLVLDEKATCGRVSAAKHVLSVRGKNLNHALEFAYSEISRQMIINDVKIERSELDLGEQDNHDEEQPDSEEHEDDDD